MAPARDRRPSLPLFLFPMIPATAFTFASCLLAGIALSGLGLMAWSFTPRAEIAG